MVSIFGKNVKTLREREGISQDKFADDLQVSNVMVWKWENKEITPRASTVDLICDKFNVTRQDLTGYIDGLYAKTHGLSNIPSDALPAKSTQAFAHLLGSVHAGEWSESEIIDKHIPIPEEVLKRHPDGFFLEVEGECMNKIYPNGCLIFIDPNREPQNGEIACVRLDSYDYIMRRIYRGSNSMILVADSFEEFEDIVITDETVVFVGTVVWFQAKEELKPRV